VSLNNEGFFSDPDLAAFSIQLATQMSYVFDWHQRYTRDLNSNQAINSSDWNSLSRAAFNAIEKTIAISINTYEKAPRIKRFNLVGCSTAAYKENKILHKKANLYYPSTEKDKKSIKQQKGEAVYFLDIDDQFKLKLCKLGADGNPIDLNLDLGETTKKTKNIGVFLVSTLKDKLERIGLNLEQIEKIHKAIAIDCDSLEVTINGKQNLLLEALKSTEASDSSKQEIKAALEGRLKDTPWKNIYGHAEVTHTGSFAMEPLAIRIGDIINQTRIQEGKEVGVAVKGYTNPVTARHHKMVIEHNVSYNAYNLLGKSITFQYSSIQKHFFHALNTMNYDTALEILKTNDSLATVIQLDQKTDLSSTGRTPLQILASQPNELLKEGEKDTVKQLITTLFEKKASIEENKTGKTGNPIAQLIEEERVKQITSQSLSSSS
jgi:hypothetical protein